MNYPLLRKPKKLQYLYVDEIGHIKTYKDMTNGHIRFNVWTVDIWLLLIIWHLVILRPIIICHTMSSTDMTDVHTNSNICLVNFIC